MSEIQQNRYDQLLRRVCDLKGPGSKVSWSVGDLLPIIDVENMPAELLLLGGARLCMARVVLAAGGAGNFGQVILRNNANTGVIGRVLEVNAFSPNAQDLVIGLTQNTLAAGGTRAFSDGRVFGQGTVLVTQANNNLLVTGSDFWRERLNGIDATKFSLPGGIAVLSPASGLQVSVSTANSALTVNFTWIERAAEPSELNL